MPNLWTIILIRPCFPHSIFHCTQHEHEGTKTHKYLRLSQPPPLMAKLLLHC